MHSPSVHTTSMRGKSNKGNPTDRTRVESGFKVGALRSFQSVKCIFRRSSPRNAPVPLPETLNTTVNVKNQPTTPFMGSSIPPFSAAHTSMSKTKSDAQPSAKGLLENTPGSGLNITLPSVSSATEHNIRSPSSVPWTPSIDNRQALSHNHTPDADEQTTTNRSSREGPNLILKNDHKHGRDENTSSVNLGDNTSEGNETFVIVPSQSGSLGPGSPSQPTTSRFHLSIALGSLRSAGVNAPPSSQTRRRSHLLRKSRGLLKQTAQRFRGLFRRSSSSQSSSPPQSGTLSNDANVSSKKSFTNHTAKGQPKTGPHDEAPRSQDSKAYRELADLAIPDDDWSAREPGMSAADVAASILHESREVSQRGPEDVKPINNGMVMMRDFPKVQIDHDRSSSLSENAREACPDVAKNCGTSISENSPAILTVDEPSERANASGEGTETASIMVKAALKYVVGEETSVEGLSGKASVDPSEVASGYESDQESGDEIAASKSGEEGSANSSVENALLVVDGDPGNFVSRSDALRAFRIEVLADENSEIIALTEEQLENAMIPVDDSTVIHSDEGNDGEGGSSSFKTSSVLAPVPIMGGVTRRDSRGHPVYVETARYMRTYIKSDDGGTGRSAAQRNEPS